MPLLTPALVAASLLVFMTSMASFSAPFLLAGGIRVLSLQIYFSKINGNLDMAAAQSVILSVISISFLLFMRWYQDRRDYQMMEKGVSHHQREIRNPWVKWPLVFAGTIGVILLLLPHGTLVILSLVPEGSWTWQTYPSQFSLENYQLLMKDPRIWDPVSQQFVDGGLGHGGELSVRCVDRLCAGQTEIPGEKSAGYSGDVTLGFACHRGGNDLILAFNYPPPSPLVRFWSAAFALPGYFVRHIPLVVRSLMPPWNSWMTLKRRPAIWELAGLPPFAE